MVKSQIEFYVQVGTDKTVTVGRSTVTMPRTQWNGKGIKWFDDSKLLKSNR